VSVDELFDEASGHWAVGELEQAATLYQQCIDIEADHFEAWSSLAMALAKTGRLKEGIGAGLMATTLRPNDLLAWTALSQMYVQDGQIGPAEDAKGKARILSLGGRIVKD
jgi:predicted Zn-dependent protease